MTLMEFYQDMNALLEGVLAIIMPDTWWGQLMVENAFLTLTVAAILVALIFLLAAFFFDFITDAWKVPFALGVDVLKYLGLVTPWFAVVSAIAGVVVFLALSDVKGGRWLFAMFSVAAAVLTLLWSDLAISVLIAIAPINTLMMFIATVVD